ncbi:hypothetical protein EAT51_19955 [Pseudoxanthomonas winnipegensis]|uniref:hypothetical protein n=1 Tax=Pseudoxanthomonas winnipegensis TaxID=2480810 RepID=UPI00102D9D0C|nr:hypothetical protein [Pseudoxanthomonas winnipegensis]TAA36378.1 hypothetical protein EAT51_19750 [Pseudoxanthomonas winnipegensis]TAA36411.1 hypothetical protein EAT51_19955 [Pseudoxanthomonas winnipegensis]
MSTDAKAKKSLTVRELQAILADCDPEATVSLSLPGFIDESDKGIADDPDVLGTQYGYTPEVSAGFLTSRENRDQFFDEANNWRPGVKPNHVTIQLAEADTERLIESRKLAIERSVEEEGLEPEPVIADANTVIVDVKLPRDLHTTIRRLLHSVNASHQVKVEQACTHGLLTVAGALEMLAEDLGMVETRPGSWEGSNMSQVLASHGYNY